MNDQYHFDFPWDDLSAGNTHGVNRILRFEPGNAVTVAEEIFDPALETQFEGVETPHRLCLPEGYTPGYAYPLIVWFHDDGGDEDDVADVMPRISERNYIGLALRGNVLRTMGHGWTTAGERWARLALDLDNLILAAQERYRIHADRMYVAGAGTGGSLAWEALLRQPMRWAGAICLSGSFPSFPHPLANFRQLHERRLLLSTGVSSRADGVAKLIDSGRLMYSAGVQVGTRMYDGEASAPTDKMLRDVDHWVMDSIATAVR
jgi:phospholipase/carboxylesterase